MVCFSPSKTRNWAQFLLKNKILLFYFAEADECEDYWSPGKSWQKVVVHV